MQHKTPLLFTSLLLALVLLAGCGTAALPASSAPSSSATLEEPVTFRIAGLRGPTSMGLVKLAADSDAGETAHHYNLAVYGTADEVLPGIVSGDIDLAAIPANAASIWYNRTEGAVQVAAVNTLGVLYVVEAGDAIHSVADLAGKTIYSTGQGTTPEFVLNHILQQNGIHPATDVQIEYKSEATEVAGLLATTPGAIAVLPQPYATVVQNQNPDVRTALDLTAEWNAVSPDSQLITAVLVARTEFIEQHPEAFAQFLQDYEASIAFANEDTQAAAVLIEAYGIFDNAAVVQKALPACNLVFLGGADMKAALSGYLAALYEQEPKAVGGQLPDDAFYHLP